MSGECDDCGEHTLECVCGEGCPCRQNDFSTHLNLVRRDRKNKDEYVRIINVRGRAEHEMIIKDAQWCRDLGLDQVYEVTVYLNRWGGWLSDN